MWCYHFHMKQVWLFLVYSNIFSLKSVNGTPLHVGTVGRKRFQPTWLNLSWRIGKTPRVLRFCGWQCISRNLCGCVWVRVGVRVCVCVGVRVGVWVRAHMRQKYHRPFEKLQKTIDKNRQVKSTKKNFLLRCKHNENFTKFIYFKLNHFNLQDFTEEGCK